jgi:ribosomal protein S13
MTNLVQNGNFETVGTSVFNTLKDNDWTTITNSQGEGINNWDVNSVIGGQHGVSKYVSTSTSWNSNPLPDSLTQFYFAQITANNVRTQLTQNINLSGGTYTITFYYSGRVTIDANGTYYDPVMVLNVKVGDQTIVNKLSDMSLSLGWKKYSNTFTIVNETVYSLLFETEYSKASPPNNIDTTLCITGVSITKTDKVVAAITNIQNVGNAQSDPKDTIINDLNTKLQTQIDAQNTTIQNNIDNMKKKSNTDGRKFLYTQKDITTMKTVNFYLMGIYILSILIFTYYIFFVPTPITTYIPIYLKLFIILLLLVFPFLLDIIEQALFFAYKYVAILLKFQKFSNPIIRPQ